LGKFSIGGLCTIPQQEAIWEIEKLTIKLYSYQMWWGRLNNNGETCTQTGRGRSFLYTSDVITQMTASKFLPQQEEK